MKLETRAGLLRAALNTVGRVVEKRTTIPVLSSVLFDGRTVRGTDLDVEIDIVVPSTRAGGRAAIDHASLLGLVRHIPGDETVTITAGKEGASLTFSSGRYELPSYNPDDFPGTLGGDRLPDRPVKIEGEALRSAIQFATPFISTEETRYYLNGVCIDGDVVVATDGHRLGCHPLGFDGAPFDKAIVPTVAVRLINALPAPKACRLGKLSMALDFDGGTVSTKLIDGTFPDWRRIVPAGDGAATLTIDRARLRSAIARLSAALPKWSRGGPCITMAWDDGHLAVVGKNNAWGGQNGLAAAERVEGVTVEGGPGFVAFNARFVTDILGAWRGSESVAASIASPGDPTLWRAGGEAYAVLMPMQGASDDLAAATLKQWPAEAARVAA